MESLASAGLVPLANVRTLAAWLMATAPGRHLHPASGGAWLQKSAQKSSMPETMRGPGKVLDLN
jgi:hypothetical protein